MRNRVEEVTETCNRCDIHGLINLSGGCHLCTGAYGPYDNPYDRPNCSCGTPCPICKGRKIVAIGTQIICIRCGDGSSRRAAGTYCGRCRNESGVVRRYPKPIPYYGGQF